MQELIEKADVLIEALPYIRNFSGKSIVVKYGGSAMQEEELKQDFARDIVLMKYVGMNPVVVHGGGPQINNMLDKLGMEAKFVQGIRVTDKETMDVVEMVLLGKINKEIVARLNHLGGRAVGLSGHDGGLIQAQQFGMRAAAATGKQPPEMGLVGEITAINTKVIEVLDRDRFIPVIAPIGEGQNGQSYNINADTVAGEIAACLRAEKLVYLTDVKGILDEKGELISSASRSHIRELIKQGVIEGGMIPKVESCLRALEAGVPKAHIIDGRIRHALLLEIFTDTGIGTQMVKD